MSINYCKAVKTLSIIASKQLAAGASTVVAKIASYLPIG